MSFNFAEYVASIIGLNMIDAHLASLTKEFIILCRQAIQSSILFKYELSPRKDSIYLIKTKQLHLS